MKFPRLFWVVFLLALFGAAIGFLLSPEEAVSVDLQIPALVKKASPEQVAFEMPEASFDEPQILQIEFPEGTVEGELVVHFRSQKDYLAYLAALRAAGYEPMGQINELLVVRIPDDALLAINLDEFGGRASFSHEVARPLPPPQLDAAALASLRAYGESARSIVRGFPHGDGSGVIVAVLDSGIDAHPQFEDIKMTRVDLTGVGVAGPGSGHGTSVASIIAGREGIVPNAELVVVRVLNEEGLGNSYDVAAGIVEAVDKGAKVINLSLGVYQDAPLLRYAIDYAAEREVVLVAAAGNDGYDRMAYPAAYDRVLSVTAIDARGSQAVFPNQSDEIDFAAPGVGVRTAREDEGTVLFSGTSAAAPFVTGTLVSLMSGKDAMESSTAIELLGRYLNDSGAPGPDPVYGAGSIDWDRLRERSTPGILDVALAGIFLNADTQPGTTMPVEVTVQNRGTEWFNEAQLDVLVNDADPVSFTIGTLGPGQTTTRRVYAQIPSAGSDEPLSVAARVLPEDLNEDVRLENNLKAVQIQPR